MTILPSSGDTRWQTLGLIRGSYAFAPFDAAQAYDVVLNGGSKRLPNRVAKGTNVPEKVSRKVSERDQILSTFKHRRNPTLSKDLRAEREDMKHHMMLELTDGRLFYSPVSNGASRILDLGTGTGLWALDVADYNPASLVVGVDLTLPQWPRLPRNVKFEVDDVEEEWIFGPDWDFIHLRSMAVILRNIQRTVNDVFENLRPGGWIEFQEIHGAFQCDDGTMADDDILRRYYDRSVTAMRAFALDLDQPVKIGARLQQAGFVNIHCVTKKVPLGPWSRDPALRRVGHCARVAALDTSKSFLGKPFAALGYSEREREAWGAQVRQALEDTSEVHRYCHYYFWFAQKPV